MNGEVPSLSDLVGGGNLQQTVNQLAPLAKSYSGPMANVPVGYQKPFQPQGGTLQQFGHFLGGFAGGVGNIATGVGSWLVRNTVQLAEAPFKFSYDFTKGAYDTFAQQHQVGQIIARQQALANQWKSGQITTGAYKTGLKDITNEQQDLSKAIQANGQRLQNSKQEGIDTAAAILTILTGPAGAAIDESIGAGATAKFLTSVSAKPFLDTVEQGLTKVAADPVAFARLEPAAQKALQTATAEIVANGTKMTAAQMTRAAAVNVAIKYPIYYNYMSSTGTQLYKELDQKKYGAATRTLAFNAGLLLSGGPIGWAVKNAGKVFGGISGATFGRTSFIDALSKSIGPGGDNLNGDIAGLYKAIQALPEAERAQVVKDMSAVEATNMSATGHDPVAAAMRVIKGMESYEGLSMSQFSHEEALNNMVNFAKAQRLADEAGRTAGIGPVAVGRVDSRALNDISSQLSFDDSIAKPNVPEVPKGQTVYRAGKPLAQESVTDRGISVTPSKKIAQNKFSAFWNKGPVNTHTLSADAKIMPHSEIPKDLYKQQSSGEINPVGADNGDYQKIVAYAKSKGYDGVDLKRFGEGEIRVFNPKHLVTQPTQGASSIIEDRLKVWEQMKKSNPTQAWANNENFDRQIKNLIAKHEGTAELDNAIKSITASFSVDGFPEAAAKELSKMGYIPIKPVNQEAIFAEGTGKVASKFAANDNFFTKAVQPLPVLGFLGDALTRLGLSPNASSERVYQIFNDSLSKNLEDLHIRPPENGQDAKDMSDTIIKQLSDYAHNPTHGKVASKLPITDLRMMTTKDVQAALGVTAAEARGVQKAITQAYIQVPLAIRGLGDRAVDRAYQLAGPAERRYLRVQGAARFSWNPFFQYLRLIPKTEILSELEGGGFISSVFRGQLKLLSPIRQILRDGGFLEEGGFGNVISGEAVDATGFASKNLTKKLLPAQENSIAGLIAAQADRVGMDWKTYIQENPDNVRSTIQMIAEYDKRSNFLNSPLARTLNLAFFPFRFETKVAMIMTRNLAKTSLMTQVSVVNGLLRGHNWLNSAEGQTWYARNAAAIGFFEYISPLATLNQVFESLLPGHDHSLGNFGELGGLPFGWIPQILDAEGLTHFNQPGVNASTGAVYSTYIPATAKGQMAIAIQDMLGTLFSYPGVQVGLPSKTSITRNVSLGIVGGNKKTDLKLNTPTQAQLSPQQQQYSQFIGGQNTTKPVPPPQTQPSIGTNPLPTSATTPNIKPSTSRSSRKKKAQFTPALLPGQSTLGQL